MSIYVAILLKVFPHSIIGPRQIVLDCVAELTSDKWADMPSSFAVTSDVPGAGQLCLWLSNVSDQRLRQRDML